MTIKAKRTVEAEHEDGRVEVELKTAVVLKQTMKRGAEKFV
jgi:hypothetical protein